MLECRKHRRPGVRSLGQDDPLEEGMAANSSAFACRIPWTEQPGRPQSMGSVVNNYFQEKKKKVSLKIAKKFTKDCQEINSLNELFIKSKVKISILVYNQSNKVEF